MSLRVAVTGASGFIGRHVTAALAARGDSPRPVRRPFEPGATTALFREVDVVIHLAGVVSAVRAEDYHAGNVEATRLVAASARDAGARVVHVSSLAAAGPAPASAPRGEDDPPNPITAYGRTKLEGEREVQATTGLEWTILRPGVVYGPGDGAMRSIFALARRGVLPLVGAPAAAYTFVYIDDAVRAILAAVDRGPLATSIFLGHPRPVTPRELMAAVRDAAGTRARIVPIPRGVVRAAAALGDAAGRLTGRPATINSRRFAELYSEGFVCRVERMREELGVVAETDLSEGLRRAAPWYLRRASSSPARARRARRFRAPS